MPEPSALQAASAAGGWVYATVVITIGAGAVLGAALWVIRWLLDQNKAVVAALDRMTTAMNSLTEEIRYSRGRR